MRIIFQNARRLPQDFEQMDFIDYLNYSIYTSLLSLLNSYLWPYIHTYTYVSVSAPICAIFLLDFPLAGRRFNGDIIQCN